VTLRIDRHAVGQQVILQLVGNLQIEHLGELRKQIKTGGCDIVLDVRALTRISVEGIRFLNSCEGRRYCDRQRVEIRLGVDGTRTQH